MKNLFKTNLLSWLVYLLSLLVVVKVIWFVVEVVWLPVKGVDYLQQKKSKALYYRVKLTSKKPRPIVRKTVKKQPIKQASGRIKEIKLIGIYHSSSISVVTVMYKSKTKVLSQGEEINGFILEDTTNEFARFSKNNQSYKLFLEKMESKLKSNSSIIPSKKKRFVTKKKTNVSKGKIEKIDNSHRIIDRSLVNHYLKDLKSIEKEIGSTPVKKGDEFEGFRITFVKRGSDFAQLGLRRGDVITSVNGEALNSYGAALGMYKNIKTTENLTFVIKRGKQEMELEYEVN